MARTKPFVRRTLGSKSCCRQVPYVPCYVKNRVPKPRKRYPLCGRKRRKPRVSRMNKTVVIPKWKSPEDFPFYRLPQELQTSIWEMVAEERRVVSVRVSTGGRLRSNIPPMLHVCAESRAIGLRSYEICFSSTERVGKLFFNFDRDVLYFGPNWNKGVKGEYGCMYHNFDLFDHDDFQRIRSVCIDLEMCSCVFGSKKNHWPEIRYWSSLETLYLALRQGQTRSDKHLELRERETHPEAWLEFLNACEESPSIVADFSKEFLRDNPSEGMKLFEEIKVTWRGFFHMDSNNWPHKFSGEIHAVSILEL